MQKTDVRHGDRSFFVLKMEAWEGLKFECVDSFGLVAKEVEKAIEVGDGENFFDLRVGYEDVKLAACA